MSATTYRFTPDANGADRAEGTLERLQKEGLIKVHDAAIVSWADGAKKPKTRQLNSLTGVAALSGSFWGLLFGLIFLVPLIGMAVLLVLVAAAVDQVGQWLALV